MTEKLPSKSNGVYNRNNNITDIATCDNTTLLLASHIDVLRGSSRVPHKMSAELSS